jgi:hypothetical protein
VIDLTALASGHSARATPIVQKNIASAREMQHFMNAPLVFVVMSRRSQGDDLTTLTFQSHYQPFECKTYSNDYRTLEARHFGLSY